MDDLISRKTAIDALERIFDRCEEIEAHLPEGDPDRVGYKMYPDWLTVWKYLHQLPSAQSEQTKMIKEIREWINSGNRGSADYFIVDKIEEIINKYERRSDKPTGGDSMGKNRM